MRQIPLVFFCCAVLFFACENTTPTNAPVNALSAQQVAAVPVQTLQGMYRNDAQGAFFYDCTAGETYQVVTRPAGLDSTYRTLHQPPSYPGEPVFAVLHGKVITPNQGPTQLVVTKVDTLIVRTLLNNCQPYDFWCIGTEPFWGLVISGSEGKIALKLIAEGQGKVFPWVQPKQEGEFILYESTDPETGEKIQVLLRKEPCSDGMSERMYPYSAKLKYGGQMLQGCALK
ncbi:MAG: hypothetical protein H6569_08370 [Lewinellaceae bacterium]|nr:hypothetical protein [Lewinellaceae bacterium]